MAKADDGALREQLVKFLSGGEAHAELKAVVDDFPEKARGAKPKGAEHSAWQQVEHIRLALEDLLEFSTNPNYAAKKWPDDYWPEEDAPENDAAWKAAVRGLKKTLADFEKLVKDPETNLYAAIPWGDGQTIFREVLLAGQHTSYHAGQLVALRRELGVWK
ncbi:MAG TPA: DinB family protein [Acidobacteriaceae bacterium]|nr:DinB family protein [Acidobacteriaceae bacterium]